MRILQIDNSLGMGGAEKLILDTVPLYRKAGIEMDVLVVVDNDYPFAKELQKQNCCKFFILNKNINDKVVYNPLVIFKIKKILKDYDIAHLHVFPTQYYAVIANILNGNKTKLILTEHNTSNSRITKSFLKPIEKFIYSKYKKVICITEEIKNIYQNYLQLDNKLVTINNGVDVDKIVRVQPHSRESFGYKEDDIIMVMVARFTEQKDQDTVIKSLQYLPESYKLILVGDGWRREELQNLVTQLNLQNRVNFLGVRIDVYSIYKMSNIAVLSSHWEGFGIAAVEAMACEVPVIASNVKGLSSVVEGAGLLFEQGNTESLIEKILFLDNSQLSKQVSIDCFNRAKDYDIKKMVQKHIELYNSVL